MIVSLRNCAAATTQCENQGLPQQFQRHEDSGKCQERRAHQAEPENVVTRTVLLPLSPIRRVDRQGLQL